MENIETYTCSPFALSGAFSGAHSIVAGPWTAYAQGTGLSTAMRDRTAVPAQAPHHRSAPDQRCRRCSTVSRGSAPGVHRYRTHLTGTSKAAEPDTRDPRPFRCPSVRPAPHRRPWNQRPHPWLF